MTEKRSQVQRSELRAIFTDYDNEFEPYEGRALEVSISADVLFLSIGKLTSERDKDTFERVDDDTIGVDAQLLYETLGAMLRRDDRFAYDRLVEGTLQADDSRLRAATVTGQTPAVRVRA